MKHFFTILFGIVSLNASACDICGCSAGTNALGLLPSMNKHFIGLRFQQNNYSSTPHESGASIYSASNEYFKTVDIWGRYSLSKRFQLMGFVPYKLNKRVKSSSIIELKGLGDASILLNYQLIKLDNKQKWKQSLLIGIGAKLPTGKFDAIENHLFVNENIQLGTGSIDIPFSINYSIRKNKLGVNAEANYKANSTNKQHFKFGDKASATARLFYQTKYKQYALIPQLALNYEHNNSNTRDKIKEMYTNGFGMQNQYGIDIYYKKIGLNFQYSFPIKNNYGEGHIENKGRFSSHLIYLF
jgi:hypothetical protein